MVKGGLASLFLAIACANPAFQAAADSPSTGPAPGGSESWLAGERPTVADLEKGLESRLAWLSELGPRAEGSLSEQKAASRIFADIKASGLDPEMLPLTPLVDDQSDSVSVSVTIRGARKDLLAFIVPLDTVAKGTAHQGNAAIALMLCELQRMGAAVKQGKRPPLGIEVVFLPADRRYAGDGAVGPGPGAGWWLDRTDAANPTVVVYLALDTVPARLDLIAGERGNLAPWWLFARARSALKATGIAVDFHPNRLQGFRLGLLKSPGLIAPYLDKGYPAIELRSSKLSAPARDGLTHFSDFVEGFVTNNATGFPDTWDRDYSFFAVGPFVLQIHEGSYVLFLLCFTMAVTGLVLFLSLRRRTLIPHILRKLPHRVLNLGLLAIVASASSLLSLACLGLETLIFGSSSAWQVAPVLFVLTRFAMSILTFLGLLSLAVSLRWISPDPWFYEIASLILFGVDILVFAFLSFPLSIYFCWGFIVVLASTFIRRKAASLVAVILMALPFFLVGAEMVKQPSLATLAMLIAPDPLKEVSLILVVLPFSTMLASPLLFFAPRGLKQRRTAAALFLFLAVGCEVAALGRVAIRADTIPIFLSETFDQSSSSWTAKLRSDFRLSRVQLERKGLPEDIDTRKGAVTLRGKDSSKPIAIRIESTNFLGRENKSITITFPASPDSTVLRLHSQKPLAIYDCTLPYRVDLNGLGASIFAGPGKGDRLSFTLTTEAGFSANLSVEASFAGGIADWRIEGPRSLRLLDGQIRATFDLHGASP